MNGRTGKLDLITFKNFRSVKDNVKKMRRQATVQDKALLPKIDKELLTLTIRKQTTD